MSSTNGFLKDFIEMRKSLKQTTPNLVKPDLSDPKKKKATKTEKPTEKKPKSNIFDVKQLNDQKAQEEEEEVDMLQRIIDEKLPKRDVIEYLQNFANDLTIEKMK